jgi:bacterioferritin
MKGNQKLIDKLNDLLALERTGEDQYKIHRAKFVNLQLLPLIPFTDERIGDERKHQTLLEDRILFLGGTIVPAAIKEVLVGDTLPAIFVNDAAAETASIAGYNEAIALAVSVGDEDTAAMLREILRDETDHINDIEARQMQMTLVGEQLWAATQIREC